MRDRLPVDHEQTIANLKGIKFEQRLRVSPADWVNGKFNKAAPIYDDKRHAKERKL